MPVQKKITVSGLYMYPLKSAKGVSLDKANIDILGIQHDRRWAVYEEGSGMFVAQRAEHAGVGIRQMCLIEPSLREGRLYLSAPNMLTKSLPIYGIRGEAVSVQIWDDIVQAEDQGDEIAKWLTHFLSVYRHGRYRLARLRDANARKTKIGDGQVRFSDAYPVLVASEESLADLNTRISPKVPMDRFRPNIVLQGCAPYEEDTFMDFAIRKAEFSATKLCERCVTVTIDQQNGQNSSEPLRTLASYRKVPSGVVFGNNFVVRADGEIGVGDHVNVWSKETA